MAKPERRVAPRDSLERRYRLLVESINDYAIYMLTPEGIVDSWNAGAQQFKGYTAGEIIGHSFARFYTPEDQAAGKPARALAIARKEGKFEGEGWRVRKDGSRFWAHVVIDPIVEEDGTFVGYAKITRDITDKKRTEEALRRREAEFRLLVKGVTDYAIYMLSPEGIISNWNLGAERIKGFAGEEVVGTHFSRFYTPEDRERGMPATALATAAREGRFEAEGWRVRKDGTRFWAHVVIDPVHDDDGRMIGFAKITRDITERRAAEEKLEETRAALVQSQKMEAIGRLTGGVAHDFNNLLAGILGNLDLMRLKLAEGETADLERYLDAAVLSAKRSAGLTHRLLAYSRRQTLSPKPVDTNALVAGMADLFDRSVGPQISVKVELEPDLWWTCCDPNQLESALLNLVINSRDALPEGGTIRVVTRRRRLGEEEAVVRRGLAAGDYVSIAMIDDGTGMPADVREHAFEPFFTTKPLGEGTGLGLSMVQGFIRQSEGHVDIASAPGRGTTVTLYLPRYAGPVKGADAAPGAGIALARPQGAAPRVLLVDDEAAVRRSLEEMLTHAGYDVTAAGNAPEALALLDDAALQVDLLVTDIGLPAGMNGRQLAGAARAGRPALPVLFITGYAEQSVLGASPLPEGMRIMVKPFAMEDFVEVVQEMTTG